MAALERRRTQPHKPSQQNAKAVRQSSAQTALADPSGTLNMLITLAGMIAGIYVANVYVAPQEDWHIFAGIVAGGSLTYLLREPIKVVLKISIVLALIYAGIVHVLPALSG